jgi:hypothetical protein
MIERGETPGDQIGLLEGRRGGGDKTETAGRHGQNRQQRQRVERGHGMAALQRIERHVQHGQVIGHEESVELAALQRLREALQMRQIEIGVGIGAGIAPPAGMNGCRPHESAEPQLTLRSHSGLLMALHSARRAARRHLALLWRILCMNSA